MTRYSSRRKKPIVRGKATARIRPLGEAHLKRSGVINQGMSLYTILGSTNRTFTFSDVPAMLEDDQIALGVDYLKIPIAQAPIAVTTSHPQAYGYATDLIQRIWDALISKIDLSLAYGESCYEPLYKKDKKNMLWWDFHDFDIAPPMSSIPWTVNEKLAFVAVHGDGVTNSSYFSYWFDSESVQEADVLEGAGVYRPTKALWICNDPLTSRWYGRTVLRPAHLRWKVKNMPDGGMESVAKALFKAAFSGLLLEYPANTSVVSEDGSVITSEQYADFLLQVVKSGSNVRLPSTVEGQPGWKILEYAKNLVDTAKLVPTLDYIDRGMLRGMGIPDDILNQGDKGGYSRSLVSIDAFYSRGEARARQYLPRIIDDIVNPLLRQRWGPQCEAKAHIMRQPRPDDNGQQQGGMDSDNNDIPDALEGAMRGNQGQQKALPGPNQQPPGKIGGVQQAQQDGQTRFSLLMNRMSASDAWHNEPRDAGGRWTNAHYNGQHQHIYHEDGKEVGEIVTRTRDDGHHEVKNILVWPQHQRKGHGTRFYRHAAIEAARDGKKLFVSSDLTDDAKAIHGSLRAKGHLGDDGHLKFYEAEAIRRAKSGEAAHERDLSNQRSQSNRVSGLLQRSRDRATTGMSVTSDDSDDMEDGQLASRDANSGLIASGIAVVAKDTGRVLMLQRHHEEDSKAAGTWEFPGGHIEDDEEPYEAASREWMEEVGQSLPKGKRTGWWNAVNGKYRGYVYLVPSEKLIDIHQGEDRDKVNPDDPDGDCIEVVAWFDPSHLRDNPAIRAEVQEDMHLIEPLIVGAGDERAKELPKDTP